MSRVGAVLTFCAIAALASPAAAAEALDELRQVGRNVPATEVAALLARAASSDDAEDVACVIASMLPENAPLFDGRTSDEVDRLRALMFATLATVGIPIDAIPLIAGEIAHGHKAVTVAAAFRAAASSPAAANAVAQYTIRFFEDGLFHDDQVSLTEYAPAWPLRDPTCARLEGVRALGAIEGRAADLRLVLDRLAATDFHGEALEVAIREAIADARRTIDSAAPHSCHTAPAEAPAFVSPWLRREARELRPLADLVAEDQSGNKVVAAKLQGKPLALTFFYTGCDNARKCGTTISRFSALQRRLADAGLGASVRLAAVTYDAAHDTPFRLAQFASGRRLDVGESAVLLRPSTNSLQHLADSLHLAVSYAGGRPNAHAVELFLLDREGFLVRSYRNVLWDEAAVVRDMERLVLER